MSLAFERSVCVAREVAVVRTGVLAHEVCRRGGWGEIAAIFERSLYLRVGDDFICIGEPSIGNGPTTLIVAARVAELGLRRGQPAFIGDGCIVVGDVLLDFDDCATWRAPPWPALPSPAALRATCVEIIRRAAEESPADSLARAVLGAVDTPLARLARPRVMRFEGWVSGAVAGQRAPSLPPKGGLRPPSLMLRTPTRSVGYAKRAVGRVASEASRVGGLSLFACAARVDEQRPPPLTPPRHSLREWGEGDPTACAGGLIGLGYGLTPSGDDFLAGALAMLDALKQTNMHAALARALLGAADRTSPLSASFLRAAAAGHIGEDLHTMVAAILAGDGATALDAAHDCGHTSGWDTLAGVMTAARACSPHGAQRNAGRPLPDFALRAPSGLRQDHRC
jgi:hypothetical protein